MALDATPKGSASNSYVTEADATTYLQAERLYTVAWDDADSLTRERALIWATQLFDVLFDWYGSKTTLEQRLRQPRAGTVDYDGQNIDQDTISLILEKATATQALHLLENDTVLEPILTSLGMAEAKLGSLEAKIDKKFVHDVISQEVISMLAPFGDILSSGLRGDKAVDLSRS